MIWAAAAMGLYNSGSTAGATAAVGEVAKGLLGPVGGIIAILGVIVLPITSGDTALRSCRLDGCRLPAQLIRKPEKSCTCDIGNFYSCHFDPCFCKNEYRRI